MVSIQLYSQTSKLLIWKDTCWFTVERILLFAKSATAPAQELIASIHTCWPIQKKPFVCIQRNYLFTQAGCLQTHMLIHSGETLLDCTECNYSCNNHKEHMQTHSGDKPFGCTQCDFSCTQAQNLESHKLTHIEEKSFACKQCSYSSSNSKTLKCHMRSHIGEKPFGCKQCK